MRLLGAQQVLSLIACVSAFVVRDTPLNLTTTAPWDLTQVQSSWTGTQVVKSEIESPLFKPHFESTVDGFDSPSTTSIKLNVGNARTTEPPKPDIGSLIQDYLTSAMPVPSSAAARFEVSEDGWGEVTLDPAIPSDYRQPPHLEATEDGFGLAPTTGITPYNRPQMTSPDGRIIPQVTNPPVLPVPQVTPPPAITYGGVTLRPVIVTSVRVVTVDGKPTTVSSIVNYRYVVGSATLQVGAPTTINNVVVALSIDTSGSTILVAGDQTTILPVPAQVLQGGEQTTASSQAFRISTTIVEGTTKYVLAGQTLAPGQAVTVGSIPISIGLQGGSTVLVMGDVTTTFAGGAATTTTTPEWGASVAATFGIVSGNGNKQSATTSVSVGAGNSRSKGSLLAKLGGVAVLVWPFV